jgi:hypothetical protein
MNSRVRSQNTILSEAIVTTHSLLRAMNSSVRSQNSILNAREAPQPPSTDDQRRSFSRRDAGVPRGVDFESVLA